MSITRFTKALINTWEEDSSSLTFHTLDNEMSKQQTLTASFIVATELYLIRDLIEKAIGF